MAIYALFGLVALALPLAAYALGRWRGWERGFAAACAAAHAIPGVADMARQERYRRTRSANAVRRGRDAIHALGPSCAPAAEPPQGRPPARSEASEAERERGTDGPDGPEDGQNG